VASGGPYASLHLAKDRQPRQHLTTQFFTGRMPFLPPNQQRLITKGYYENYHFLLNIYQGKCIYLTSAFIAIPSRQLTAKSSAECSLWWQPSWSLLTGHLHTMCYISNNSADNKIYKSTTIRTTTVLRPLQDNRRSPALTVKNYKSTKNNSLSRLCNTNLEFLQTLQSMMFSITIHFWPLL